MVYHVGIVKRTGGFWSREIAILDLSRHELINNIVTPYHNGEEFTVDGRVIDPFNIEKIRINETQDDSTVLIPSIQKREKLKRAVNRRKKIVVITGRTDRWYVTEEGNDVTNQFIKHPPQRRENQKRYKIFDRKNLKWLASVILIAYIGALFLQLNPIPDVAYVKNYNFGKNFFPDVINFYSDSDSDGYITTYVLYLSKIGEKPAILYIEMLDSSQIMSREYGQKTFNENCKVDSWMEDQDKIPLKFELKEDLTLENFTLHFRYGINYYLYPFFNHIIGIDFGSSHSIYCVYEKNRDHYYILKDSSLIN